MGYLLAKNEFIKIKNLPQLYLVVDWSFKCMFPKYLWEDTFALHRKLCTVPHDKEYFAKPKNCNKNNSFYEDLEKFYWSHISSFDNRIKQIYEIKKDPIRYYEYNNVFWIDSKTRPKRSLLGLNNFDELSLLDLSKRFHTFKEKINKDTNFNI